MTQTFHWAELVAMVRSVAKGPNFVFSQSIDDPANTDSGRHTISIYHDSVDHMTGLGLYSTQQGQSIIRRFAWQRRLDKELFHKDSGPNESGQLDGPLRIVTEYWITRDSAALEIDAVVSRIKQALLSRAIAIEAGVDFEGQCSDSLQSMYSWVRVKHGTGSLIQDGVDSNVYCHDFRILESYCNVHQCHKIDKEKVSEMYYCDIYVGKPSIYDALEFLNLPYSLYGDLA